MSPIKQGLSNVKSMEENITFMKRNPSNQEDVFNTIVMLVQKMQSLWRTDKWKIVMKR